MKLLYVLSVLILALFILGCDSQVPATTPGMIPTPVEVTEPEIPINEAPPVENTAATPSNTCTFNSNCTQGSFCIDNECKTISSLYQTTECAKKCNFNNLVIETSDKESYTVARGQGSYTAAGALQWSVMTGPSYCPGSPVVVPISILKKNYGEIYGDEVIILKKGETSQVIKHPLVKRVAFTLKVKEFAETCS